MAPKQKAPSTRKLVVLVDHGDAFINSLEPDEIVLPISLVRDQNVTATAKLVYGVLKTFLDQKRESCSPSLVEIAERSGIVMPNVPRNLKNLEAAGYISISRERKRNQYQFLK